MRSLLACLPLLVAACSGDDETTDPTENPGTLPTADDTGDPSTDPTEPAPALDGFWTADCLGTSEIVEDFDLTLDLAIFEEGADLGGFGVLGLSVTKKGKTQTQSLGFEIAGTFDGTDFEMDLASQVDLFATGSVADDGSVDLTLLLADYDDPKKLIAIADCPLDRRE